MKFSVSTTSVLLFGCWLGLTAASRNPSNPPSAKTGAPGEGTCADSGCHNGGTFTGTVELSGLPDTVTANQTYDITLTQTSNATRGGFQITCLDASNTKCGTWTAGTGNNVSNAASGRSYVRQSAAKNLTNGSVSWSFKWKAPATLTNPTVKFYFTSLAANGNGQRTGDNVLKAEKAVSFTAAVSPTTEIADAKSWLDFKVRSAGNELEVNLLKDDSGELFIFDLSGRQVANFKLNASNRLIINDLPSANYVARVSVPGKSAAQQFFKN